MNKVGVSEQMKSLRLSHSLTLDEAANISKYSKWTIINWESGKRSPKVEDLNLYILRLFDMSLDEFFASNPSPCPQTKRQRGVGAITTAATT